MALTTDQTISVSDLKYKIKELIDACSHKGQRFNIARNSDIEAVLVGITEWKMLNETLDILADRSFLEQIRDSELDIAQGRVESAEDVLNRIGRGVDGRCDKTSSESPPCRTGSATTSDSQNQRKKSSKS